jgi:hypothetical protein
MQRNPWPGTDAEWPYELFTFAASVSTMPAVTRGPLTGPIPADGVHTHGSGALDLIVAGCSVLALVQWHVARARRR